MITDNYFGEDMKRKENTIGREDAYSLKGKENKA